MLIRFDENGFYETENERLIRRLSAKFETAGNQSKEASRTEAAPAIDTPLEFVCQKCGRKCKSASGLASHEKACKG
jgi:ribosomal protein L44E